MVIAETDRTSAGSQVVQEFIKPQEYEGRFNVHIYEPPLLDATMHAWGSNTIVQLSDDYTLQIAAHMRSKSSRQETGCGDHFGVLIQDIPGCGKLIVAHGDDALGIAWKDGWNQKVNMYEQQLNDITPLLPWRHPDVVHANIMRGFPFSRAFEDFAKDSASMLTDAYEAELFNRSVHHHPYPSFETVIRDINWSLLQQKSRYLQTTLFDRLQFVSSKPNFLKWYFNSVFGHAILFIPDIQGNPRLIRNPMIFAASLRSNADYVAEYSILPENVLFDHEDATIPDPNKLPEELTRQSGKTGEELEDLRLKKPGEVYATYPTEDCDLSELRHRNASGTTESTDTIPASMPVRIILKSDGIGPPETSLQRFDMVNNNRRLQDDVTLVNHLSPKDADIQYTEKGYTDDDRSILSISLNRLS